MEQFIKVSVERAGLPVELVEILKALLLELGVDNVKDLSLVTENDLTTTRQIKVIHARKLLELWIKEPVQ